MYTLSDSDSDSYSASDSDMGSIGMYTNIIGIEIGQCENTVTLPSPLTNAEITV